MFQLEIMALIPGLGTYITVDARVNLQLYLWIEAFGEPTVDQVFHSRVESLINLCNS